MKLLIDESLSVRVAHRVRLAGHDAVHLSELGLLGSLDEQVMQAARVDGRVVVAADTDFGEMLALGRHLGPSVILLRRASHRPDAQADLLLASLGQFEDDLVAGAIVVLAPGAARIRRLPI